jgi:hypothetical protein
MSEYDPQDDAVKSYYAAIEAKRLRGDADCGAAAQDRLEASSCTCGAAGTGESHEDWCEFVSFLYCSECDRYETDPIFLDVEKCSKCFEPLGGRDD